MPVWPFQRSQAKRDAEALLAVVTGISRNEAFFGEGRISDTLEGRFEFMTLNAALALMRLRTDPTTEPLAQIFTDLLFKQFDAGLREAGVGDLSVPKRMHKLAGAFYGRLRAYEAGFNGDDAALARSLGRNMLGDEEAPYAANLAAYARRTMTKHARAPLAALLTPDGWRT